MERLESVSSLILGEAKLIKNSELISRAADEVDAVSKDLLERHGEILRVIQSAPETPRLAMRNERFADSMTALTKASYALARLCGVLQAESAIAEIDEELN